MKRITLPPSGDVVGQAEGGTIAGGRCTRLERGEPENVVTCCTGWIMEHGRSPIIELTAKYPNMVG
ncbi:MAG: hypothetical protein ACR2N1_25870 [Rubripirellula sp.]